jgi:hypothetical protein
MRRHLFFLKIFLVERFERAVVENMALAAKRTKGRAGWPSLQAGVTGDDGRVRDKRSVGAQTGVSLPQSPVG